MAITINDQPYKWALRGQKLMIVATSTEIAQVGFKYGVSIALDGVGYEFFLSPAPDGKLYFLHGLHTDLYPGFRLDHCH